LPLKCGPLETAPTGILATIPLSDQSLPSLDDVQLLSGLDQPEDIVDWCHGMGAKNVVLKLGGRGCMVSDGGRRTAVPPLRVNAIDATGAGDCFDGSYLGRLASGDDMVSAARWAGVAAALTTTGYGAVDPLPTAQDVQSALQTK